MKSANNTILFIILLILPIHAFSAKLDRDEGVRKLILKHNTQGESYPALIDQFTPGEFQNFEEWIRFLKKITREEEIVNDKSYPELCYKIGDLLQQYQQYREAYYFFYTTLKEEPNVNTSDKAYLADFHLLLGQAYYYFRRYDLALEHLMIALHHPALTEVGKIKVYNSLGLIYRDKLENEQAREYTQKAYDQAKKLNHESWIGIISGNLGYLFLQEQDYPEARKLLLIDYETSKKKKERVSQISALRYLIQLDIFDNDLEAAETKLEEYKRLLEGRQQANLLAGYYESLTWYYERIGKHREAFDSYRKYVSEKEIVDRKRHFLNIENAEFQISFEKKQAEIQIYRQKKKTDNLIIFGLLGICLLLGGASFIIIRQLQSKRRKDREILELKNQRIAEELNYAEREIRGVLSSMADKNKLISELRQEIESMQSLNSEKHDAEKEKLLSNLQSFSLLTENDWVEFKRLFERLNHGFFEYFHENYPEVTTAEIRLAALIKLNLSNYEMSRTLGISPDSVRKTNLRLRKKLDIEQPDELIRFVKAIV